MKMPCTGDARMALEFNAERKAGHRRAFTEIMHPIRVGGECRSAYHGASRDLNSRLRLVAQMSSPSTCSKSFLLLNSLGSEQGMQLLLKLKNL